MLKLRFFYADEGIFWLIDLESRVIFIVHSSRTRQPAIEFARAVRAAVIGHLEHSGWVRYHAGAVNTRCGVIMIVGDAGAVKTLMVLYLVVGGAQIVSCGGRAILYRMPSYLNRWQAPGGYG